MEGLLNDRKLDDATETLKAIAHPIRLSIIEYIDEHKQTNVNNIYNSLQLEQSITSQHLKILRTAELVNTQRNGKFIIYSINYDKVVQVTDSVERLLKRKMKVSS